MGNLLRDDAQRIFEKVFSTNIINSFLHFTLPFYATFYRLRLIRYSLYATLYIQRFSCYSLYTTLFTLLFLRYSVCATLFTLHLIRYSIYARPYTLLCLRYILHATPFTLRFINYTLYLTPYTLHFIRNILYATFYTLHFIRNILHVTVRLHITHYAKVTVTLSRRRRRNFKYLATHRDGHFARDSGPENADLPQYETASAPDRPPPNRGRYNENGDGGEGGG